ncbi:MAG TPA: zinc ribbon domain-containing protein [Candidatus Limnocylindria bacterium]|nr:zinc ribbon domain-containing protein [Candidatus Limnocylindria bacterium]
MTSDSLDCFNCGRSNPSWAQVCRSCGVPMRPGGAGARPPSGPLPTDRDSLLSMGAGLATIALAVVFGLLLSGMLPEAASVIETPSPQPTTTILPSPSGAATESAEPTPEPTPGMIGTLTFGLGLNQSTREVIDLTDTFTQNDQFCHSVSLPERFAVNAVQEEVLRIEENGDLTIVQERADGANPIDKNARVVGFCVSGAVVINEWGTGDFIMRDYRRRNGLELLAEGRFTLE